MAIQMIHSPSDQNHYGDEQISSQILPSTLSLSLTDTHESFSFNITQTLAKLMANQAESRTASIHAIEEPRLHHVNIEIAHCKPWRSSPQTHRRAQFTIRCDQLKPFAMFME